MPYRPLMTCNYCDRVAIARIPAVASEVCLSHAILFWTGLLASVRNKKVVADLELAPVHFS